MGFIGEKCDRKTGTQGKGSGGNQNLFIRLASKKKTTENLEVIRSATYRQTHYKRCVAEVTVNFQLLG